VDLATTVVDFGLSRFRHSVVQTTYWTPIPEDVYDGVGEQWDVYRRIRDHIDETGSGDWSGFYPKTNVMVRINAVLCGSFAVLTSSVARSGSITSCASCCFRPNLCGSPESQRQPGHPAPKLTPRRQGMRSLSRPATRPSLIWSRDCGMLLDSPARSEERRRRAS
jgi:hypothetical protein